ncbi:MaoC family dehydratase [Cryptosporangium aurantiacum]|uniref:Acyl dehydratase n=1 Tax=Cryptosporangium aurantiacum TaxID=134849 RepID=A0A1M7QCG2_9ACTN|nr:MaoC/PaaZ C-terminal domain-containing protein [Cryptosporangium aurantiacum]SHN28404.1 Acyl dehydratase [Cryptosporangium aurantiacum]
MTTNDADATPRDAAAEAPPTRVLDRAPNLAILYPKALLKRGGGKELSDTRLVQRDVRVDPERLAEYARVCGFGLGSTLPGTYPHVLAFPLAIALMSEPGFPFPLPGIVHIANTITQLRPIGTGEPLTFTVGAQNLRPHRRGRQFDIVTEARVGDERVWHGTATYLRRGSGDETAAGPASDAVVVPPTAVWRVSGGCGRAYGAASGDRNPIHLYPLTAKLFGFPRAIAHGMWVKARCLAALGGRLPDAYTVDVRFGKPVLLPATVDFGAKASGGGWDLSVASKGRPHLTGRVAPAPESATPHPG